MQNDIPKRPPSRRSLREGRETRKHGTNHRLVCSIAKVRKRCKSRCRGQPCSPALGSRWLRRISGRSYPKGRTAEVIFPFSAIFITDATYSRLQLFGSLVRYVPHDEYYYQPTITLHIQRLQITTTLTKCLCCSSLPIYQPLVVIANSRYQATVTTSFVPLALLLWASMMALRISS